MHWKQAKRILKYLQGTKSYGLKFNKGQNDLRGYVDVDWAGYNNDRESYTGFCFTLSNCAASWESRKQKTVVLNSREAKYITIAEASKKVMFLEKLIA